MYQFSTNDGPKPEEVRERLRKMTNEQLLRFREGRQLHVLISNDAARVKSLFFCFLLSPRTPVYGRR